MVALTSLAAPAAILLLVGGLGAVAIPTGLLPGVDDAAPSRAGAQDAHAGGHHAEMHGDGHATAHAEGHSGHASQNETCDDHHRHHDCSGSGNETDPCPHGHGCPTPCECDHREHCDEPATGIHTEMRGFRFLYTVGATSGLVARSDESFMFVPPLGTDVALVEVQWHPNGVLGAHELRLDVPAALEEKSNVTIEGPSILRAEVPAATEGGIAEKTWVWVSVGPTASTLALNQWVEVAFTSFVDVEIPEGFSAFGGGNKTHAR